MSYTSFDGNGTTHHEGSNIVKEKIIILDSDGSRVEVEESDLIQLIDTHLTTLLDKIYELLMNKSGLVEVGSLNLSLGIPQITELIKNFELSVKEHNQAVIQNLVAKHNQAGREEYLKLTRLAKELGVKVE